MEATMSEAVDTADLRRLLASLAEATVIGVMGWLVGASLAEVAVVIACWTLIVWWQP